ncbi:MAG TPA: hypothetical protein ENK48_04755 [Gammaproteobacteria bacterium]|nr:hypothetical protein [Gammaproteobacteria bacterium]
MKTLPSLTLYVPGLLGRRDLRASFRAEAATQDLGLLAWFLSRARAEPLAGGHHGGLCALCGLEAEEERALPLAALSRLGEEEGTPAGGCWLRADPVCLEADRDCVVLRDRVVPAPDQVDSLLALLNGHLAEEGLRLEASAPERWYLSLAQSRVPETWPLAHVLGQDIHPWMPAGTEGRRWRRLLNEIQMLLHDCDINHARRAEGSLPVTSLWPWGGGCLPPASSCPWSRLWGNDPLVRGLARWGGISHGTLPGDGDALLNELAGPSAHLVVEEGPWRETRLGEAEAWAAWLAAWQARWLAPLLAACRAGRLGGLALCDGAGRCYRLEGRWRRWWRRPRPFGDFL